ncbi:hypothetical protein FGB62_242g013 [Gracilaria domingensis]|nr:hypothetical protein FGB62_242g013 [Gracilaria domingensis]
MSAHVFKSLLPKKDTKFAFRTLTNYGTKIQVHNHFQRDENADEKTYCSRSTVRKRNWRTIEKNKQKEKENRRRRRLEMLESETLEERERRLAERRRKYALRMAAAKRTFDDSSMVALPQNSDILSTREDRLHVDNQYTIVTKVDRLEVFSHLHTFQALGSNKAQGKVVAAFSNTLSAILERCGVVSTRNFVAAGPAGALDDEDESDGASGAEGGEAGWRRQNELHHVQRGGGVDAAHDRDDGQLRQPLAQGSGGGRAVHRRHGASALLTQEGGVGKQLERSRQRQLRIVERRIEQQRQQR